MIKKLDQTPDYDVLFETLLKKTKEGKLDWQETADENKFIVAVQGKQTFEISLIAVETGKEVATHEIEYYQAIVLKVKDSEGKVLFESPFMKYSYIENNTASQLYNLAKRIATNVDEKLQRSLQLLENL